MSHKSSFIVCLLLLGVLAPVCHAYLFNHPSYHHHHRGLDDLLSFGRAHNPYESLSRRPQPRYECPPPLKHQRLHISETDEAYVLKVTLPGVHKRDISVDIDGTTLKLKALRMPQSGCEYNGGRYDAYGRFLPNAEEWREVVPLPVYHLPTELVSASFQHQQLVITVHKPGVAREVAPVAATAAASPTAAAASPTAPAAPASPGKAEAYTAAGPHTASPASAASRPTQRAASSSPPQHNAQQQHQRQQQQQQRQQQQHQRQQQHQQQHQRKQQDTQKPLDFSWDSFERILSKFLVYVTPGTTSTTTASSTAASSSTDYDPDVFSGTDPRFYSIPVENTEAKPDSDSALVEDAPIQLDLLF